MLNTSAVDRQTAIITHSQKTTEEHNANLQIHTQNIWVKFCQLDTNECGMCNDQHFILSKIENL